MTDKDSDREVGMVLDPGGKPGTLDPALGATAFIVDGGGSVRMTRSRMQDEAADASAGAINWVKLPKSPPPVPQDAPADNGHVGDHDRRPVGDLNHTVN